MSHLIKSTVLAVLVAGSFAGTAAAAQFQASGFSDRAIIIVSGKGGMASLNPQPLPPKERGIFIVGGKSDEVSLNPQPLPPKEFGVKRKFRF